MIVHWNAGASPAAAPASKPRRVGPRRRPSLRPCPELLEGRLVLDSGAGWSALAGGSLPPAQFSSPATSTYVQEARLTSPVAGDELNYGWGMSLTSDGETLAIGAPGEDSMPGAVYVYTRGDRVWTETARLAMPEGVPGHRFGQGVAISGDGSTLAVTSRVGEWATGGASLHIYSRSESGWNLSQTITLEASYGFGGWLSISDDGGVVAGGAAFFNSAAGAAYVFSRVNGVYAMEPPILAPDGSPGDWLGEPAALSGDGRLLVLGSAYRTAGGVGRGAIYVYERSESGWNHTATLSATPGVTTGLRVAVNGDGSVLLARERTEGEAGPIDAGVVYTKSGSTWSRSAELIDPEPAPGDVYGDWVALSPDGLTAFLGAPQRKSTEGVPAGAAYVFSRTGATWEQVGRFADPAGKALDRFGMGATIRGRTIVVSSPNADDGASTDQGAVFVYHLPDGLEVATDPVDQVGRPFSPITFSAAAAGADSIATQWQVSADAGATWADVPQATSPWLTFVPTLADSGHLYRAVFTDGGGTTLATRAALLTVAKATPIVTVSADPTRWNEDATFTVRVATDGSTPRTPGGGSVTFRAGTFTATRPLVDGVATFVAPAGTFAPGAVQAVASYDGSFDPVFVASSGTLSHSVLRAVTSLTLSKDVADPYFGQPILLTGAIAWTPWNGSPPIRPTGLVYFEHPGHWKQGVGRVDTFLEFTGSGFNSYAFEREGNVIEARYLGDDWFEPSVAQPLVFDTTPAPIELNVYTEAGTLATFGATVTYRVSVGVDSYYPVSGDVRVLIEDDHGKVRERTTSIVQGAPGSVQFTDLAVGTNKVTFLFSDANGNWRPATATAYIGIWKSPTNVSVSSSDPVSDAGQEVVLTATVSEPRVGNLVTSGTVQFYVGDRLVATSPVDSLGRARLTTSALMPGSYTITAVYLGSENYQPGQSTGLAQRVEPLPVSPKPATVTTVTADAGSSVAGREVTFTATVARADGGGGPTSGLISFYIGGALVAYAPIGADGRATLRTSALVPGVYSVSATFPESADLWGSQAAPITLAVAASASSPLATSTVLTSTASPAGVGQALAFGAQVAGPAGAPRPTSGRVRFYLGLDAIAERPIDASGRATLEARFDAPGGYLITAVYLGADGFATSQSDHLGQVVTAPVSTSAQVVPATAPVVMAWAAQRASRAERLARLALRRPPVMRGRA
ncbi:Ig-like domain repeat protein [Paludisphaera soli]|uniref:Ig-like domain repeat protein n=1 Tax=Paludisphaera soli TaxID=2712865 RepID=UPI0013EC5A9D|nr:Ig-like domain repeat protein [Paludisphaera soli]